MGRLDGEMPDDLGSPIIADYPDTVESLKLEVARLEQANLQLQAHRDKLEQEIMQILPRRGTPEDAAQLDRLTMELHTLQGRLRLAEDDLGQAIAVIREMSKLL